jgi:uncharacterized membrane protein
MKKARTKRPYVRQPKPMRRFFQLHFKLLTCLLAGAASVFVLPHAMALPARWLLGWDIAVVLYLVFVFLFVARCGVDQIKQRAAVQDEGAIVILLLTILAAFASLAALVALIGDKSQASSVWRPIFAVATIVLSWLFIHTIFTLHYAHEFYGDRRDSQQGGLEFPGTRHPDYWDFLYFSLVIAMTSQVSDVQITSRELRRVVSLHGVLSFFFNLGIVALTINMLASAIS